jgi:hypothetical protein
MLEAKDVMLDVVGLV